MKAFKTVCKGKERVNFVDENDVFVGFVDESMCCEEHGYFIIDECRDDLSITEVRQLSCDERGVAVELDGYVFDTTFNKGTDLLDGFCECEMPTFRLTNGEGKEKFLCLYNLHNGYYSHGFEFGNQKSDCVYESGSI